MSTTDVAIYGVIGLIVMGGLFVVPLWRLLPRVGLPAPVSLMALVPGAAIVLWYVLAFARWPDEDALAIEKSKEQRDIELRRRIARELEDHELKRSGKLLEGGSAVNTPPALPEREGKMAKSEERRGFSGLFPGLKLLRSQRPARRCPSQRPRSLPKPLILRIRRRRRSQDGYGRPPGPRGCRGTATVRSRAGAQHRR